MSHILGDILVVSAVTAVAAVDAHLAQDVAVVDAERKDLRLGRLGAPRPEVVEFRFALQCLVVVVGRLGVAEH